MKKSYIVFSLILLFTLLFTSSVFAYDDNSDGIYYFPNNEYPPYEHGVPSGSFEEYEQVIYTSGDNTYMIFLKNGNKNYPISNYASITVLEDGSINVKHTGTWSFVGIRLKLSSDGSSWIQQGSTYINNSGYTFSNSAMPSIVYSKLDIYDHEGNIFSPEAPQVEQPKVELMKATQVEEIPQQIAKTVMIVLPVFLAIFGTLLVLYLIKSKNLLHL